MSVHPSTRLGLADQAYVETLAELGLDVIINLRFVAVRGEGDRLVTASSGRPTDDQAAAIGNHARTMAEALRLAADVLDPPPRRSRGDAA